MPGPKINFTARTWDTIMLSLQSHLQAKFPDTWRDFYECFPYDTRVSLLSGKEVEIGELVGKEDIWVYSYDHESGKIVPGKAIARKTRENAELVEVELDNGEKVKCTPDHRWMLRDGSYKQAQDLKTGDSLMPLYRKYDNKMLPDYELLRQPDDSRWHFTHRQFAPVKVDKPGFVVHHANFNRRDNLPFNLVWMTVEEHNRIGFKGKKHTLAARAKITGRPKGVQDTRPRKKRTDLIGNQYAKGKTWKWSPEARQRLSVIMQGHPCPEATREKIRKHHEEHPYQHSPEKREAISAGVQEWMEKHPDEVEARKEATRKHYREHPETRALISRRVKEGKARAEEKRVVAEYWFNHKVVAVRKLDCREDCYDLDVEGYHNFALSAGVFVHNSQMGMAWCEVVAYTSSLLNYYLDVVANNTYLDTAIDRDAVVLIGKLVGYQLRPATSAAVTVTATLPAIQGNDVIIPAGTTVTSSGGVTFRTLTEQRIPAGSLTAEIVFTEGEAHSDTFTSDGATFQKLQLVDPEVISGSITVTVDGATWEEVDSLVFATDTVEAYTISYDADNYGYVEFGDGVNGLVPPIGVTIIIAYRVGGGVNGNIGLSEINTDVTGQTDTVPSLSVTVTAVNGTYRGSGGEARETMGHAKYWIPRWVSTNGRAVTEYDFDTLATAFVDSTYGSVAFAKAKLRQEIPELNTVDLYVWSRDSSGDITTASAGLKTALQSYFMNNDSGAVRLICTDCEVQDGNNVYIDIDTTLTISDLYAAATVTSNVTTSLDELMASADNVPGESFRVSRVYEVIQGSTGVEHAVINSLTASYEVTATEATGDGTTTSFSFTLDLEPNLPVVPLTVSITAASQVAQDDGDGNLEVSSATVGTVDYDTGVVTVIFPTAPASGVSINSEYRRILDFQRGEIEFTVASDDSARKRGVVGYPPVVEYDAVTGEKGIAFTDGYQVLRDTLGDGVLYDSGGVNRGTIDYGTGAYDFTFESPPAVGSEIRSTYRQMLQTPSEDIPIDKTQLAVKGMYTIGV